MSTKGKMLHGTENLKKFLPRLQSIYSFMHKTLDTLKGTKLSVQNSKVNGQESNESMMKK